MHRYLLVFLGGGLGAVARYVLGGLIQQAIPIDFPLGTFVVNAIGCFLIGTLFSLEGFGLLSYESRLLLMIGFLGGFTTFSSFILESVGMAPGPGFWLNIIGQVVVGILSTYGGMFVGRWLV